MAHFYKKRPQPDWKDSAITECLARTQSAFSKSQGFQWWNIQNVIELVSHRLSTGTQTISNAFVRLCPFWKCVCVFPPCFPALRNLIEKSHSCFNGRSNGFVGNELFSAKFCQLKSDCFGEWGMMMDNGGGGDFSGPSGGKKVKRDVREMYFKYETCPQWSVFSGSCH